MIKENIPAQLAELERWVERTSYKHGGYGWNRPESWHDLDGIDGDAMFITTNTDLLVIDADHVVNDNGEWVPEAREDYERIRRAGGATYEERSVSGHGRHLVYDCAEYPDEPLSPIRIRYPDYENWDGGGKVPQVEIWYAAKHCFRLTGKITGDSADKVMGGENAANALRTAKQIVTERSGDDSGATGMTDAEIERLKRSTEPIPDGSGHAYAVARVAELITSAGDVLTDEQIADAVYREMQERFQGELKETFLNNATKDAARFRKKVKRGRKDKEFCAYSVKAWEAENPGKTFSDAGKPWKSAFAAGLKAQEEGKTFDTKTAKAEPEKQGLKPSDLSDLGQAIVFAREYGDRVRYNTATKFLVYDGTVWIEDDLKAQALSQQLTQRQLKEARKELRGANDALIRAIEANAGGAGEAELSRAKEAMKEARRYHSYVLKRRSSNAITATLKQAAAMLPVKMDELDSDAYILNTPGGVVDLRTGQIRESEPGDLCTKITGCAPSGEDAELYFSFLEQVTCGDTDLQNYLQEVAGMFATGNADAEKLIIAHGSGGNGKSSLVNLWALCLGTYAGSIPSESLITRRSQNKDFSIAELRGKRMIIAAELEEGTRLDTGILKKLCSTDSIMAEKKNKDPFTFRPSHSIILFTNNIPKVGTTDKGTWDRIVLVPFNARFRDTPREIKNYAQYLFDRCGGAVLQWIIEGAVKFAANGSKLSQPLCVTRALEEYKEESNWLQHFIDEECVTNGFVEDYSSNIYTRYRSYCENMGEFCRPQVEFSRALEAAGYKKVRSKKGMIFRGIRVDREPQRGYYIAPKAQG